MIYETRKPRARKFEPAAIPFDLSLIDRKWTRLSNEEGDKRGDIGSCVLGAGFKFTYNNRRYRMTPSCRYQGSIMWEHSKDTIRDDLTKLGATDIEYEWGNMD